MGESHLRRLYFAVPLLVVGLGVARSPLMAAGPSAGPPETRCPCTTSPERSVDAAVAAMWQKTSPATSPECTEAVLPDRRRGPASPRELAERAVPYAVVGDEESVHRFIVAAQCEDACGSCAVKAKGERAVARFIESRGFKRTAEAAGYPSAYDEDGDGWEEYLKDTDVTPEELKGAVLDLIKENRAIRRELVRTRRDLALPPETVLAWLGEGSLPIGWRLCPKSAGRYLVASGAGVDETPGSQIGSKDHHHTGKGRTASGGGKGKRGKQDRYLSEGAHKHAFKFTTEDTEHLPPSLVVRFICRAQD